MRMVHTVRGNATYSSFRELENFPTEQVDAGAKCRVGGKTNFEYTYGNVLS